MIVPVPPLAADAIVPVFPPLHNGSTKLALVNNTGVGSVIIKFSTESLQLFGLVTTTLYVPAGKFW